MTEKTLFEKLRYKSGMAVTLRHLPSSLEGVLALPDDATPVDDPSAADLILDFASTQSEAEERLTALAPVLGEKTGKTIFWLGYPKGSKAAGHDVNRDTIWRLGQNIGLAAIANVAVDQTWSALRLRLAKPDEASDG